MYEPDDQPRSDITPPQGAFLPDDEDEPSHHPALRRAFRIAYIVIVILVIAGLILMVFPWRPRPVPFPFDLPWQEIRIILPLP